MFSQRRNPHAVGRAAALGVLALAAIVLGLTAGTGRADEEEQQPPGKGRFGGKSGGPDAQKLESELKRKIEEVERLKKQLAETRKGEKKGGSVRVEISGANKEEVERVTAALKRALPGKDVHVSGGGPAHGGPKAEHKGPWGEKLKMPPMMESRWGKFERKAPPKAEQPKTTPRTETRPEPKRTTSDARLDSLERKLSEIVKELEALRKDRRGGEPKDKGRGPGPGSKGGREGPGKGGFGPRRSD